MRPSHAVALFSLLCAFIALTFMHASAQSPTPNDPVARGQYLVVNAGKCSDCHGEKLQGARLDFLKPGLPVMYQSPRIAGLPQLSAADATTFLETGVLPHGDHARAPMPQYRFNHDDAAAIVAYLESLK